MRVVAAIADLMGFVPILNWVAPFLMWIAGEVSGVKVISFSSAPGWTILTLLIEVVPISSMIPMWSIRTHVALREAEAQQGV